MAENTNAFGKNPPIPLASMRRTESSSDVKSTNRALVARGAAM
jgi:hypothetical protein